LAFGLGFISLTFLGFLTGFCIGKYILQVDFETSLILSLVSGIGTLLMETVLMIIRLTKWEKKQAFEAKRHKAD